MCLLLLDTQIFGARGTIMGNWNCEGNLRKMLGVTCDRQASHPGGIHST